MCESRTLVQKDRNYISRCVTCGDFQIGFGTVITCFSDEQYEAFCMAVKYHHDHLNFFGFTQEHFTRLPTFCQHVIISVDHDELQQLNELITEAQQTLEIDKLISIN